MAYTVGSKRVIKDDNTTQLSTLTVSTSDYLEITEVLGPPMFGSTSGFSFGGRSWPSPQQTTQDIYSFPFAISFPATASDTGGNLIKTVYNHGSGQSKTEGFSVGGIDPDGRDSVTKFPFAISSGLGSSAGNLNTESRLMAVASSLTECFSIGGIYHPPTGSASNIIQKFPFSAPFATATDTGGDLVESVAETSSQANTEDAFVSGGRLGTSGNWTKTIEKFPFSISSGSATDVGDLTVENKSTGGCSSSTDGFTTGGISLPGPPSGPTLTISTIEKFPFAISSGTATDIGDVSPLVRHTENGSSSETSGFVMHGSPAPWARRIYSFPFSQTSGTGTYVGDINPTGFFDAVNSQV